METASRERICELSRHFHQLGWMRGTGGGVCLRDGDRVYLAPSGRLKDELIPDDLFVLSLAGEVLESPPSATGAKVSACAPLFLAAIEQAHAGCVIHGHPVSSVLATELSTDAFRVREFEMIKGIRGHGFFDELMVPILDNTSHEHELEAPFRACLRQHPNTQAVLVRRHGIYVWGEDSTEAKRQAECLEWLFEAVVGVRRLGL